MSFTPSDPKEMTSTPKKASSARPFTAELSPSSTPGQPLAPPPKVIFIPREIEMLNSIETQTVMWLRVPTTEEEDRLQYTIQGAKRVLGNKPTAAFPPNFSRNFIGTSETEEETKRFGSKPEDVIVWKEEMEEKLSG
jgi:hypothetical protein